VPGFSLIRLVTKDSFRHPQSRAALRGSKPFAFGVLRLRRLGESPEMDCHLADLAAAGAPRALAKPHWPDARSDRWAQRLELAVTHLAGPDLADLYRAYIDCLNRRDWADLGRYVHDDAVHNGRPLGVSGYRAMLEQDVRAIPDLRFEIQLLIAEPPRIAARLGFDCTPRGAFLGLPVNGRRVCFAENVFYEFRAGKVAQVWSVIDKAAIEAQLSSS
jgi:predicted ester cyclase